MSHSRKNFGTPVKIKYEASTPATPESGFGVIYFDQTAQLPYYKNAAGSSGAISSPNFPLNATAGSAAAPTLYFGDSDSGLYAPNVDQIAIATAGVQRFAVINSDVYVTSGRLYMGASTDGFLKKGTVVSTDIAVQGSSIYLSNLTGTQIMELDTDNISCYQHIICRPDNTIDIGKAEGGTQFNPRNVYIGTGLLVGGGTSLGTSVLANFLSTTKGVVFPNITSNPSTPVAGMVVFDTNNSTGAGTNKLVVYDGTTWIALH